MNPDWILDDIKEFTLRNRQISWKITRFLLDFTVFLFSYSENVTKDIIVCKYVFSLCLTTSGKYSCGPCNIEGTFQAGRVQAPRLKHFLSGVLTAKHYVVSEVHLSLFAFSFSVDLICFLFRLMLSITLYKTVPQCQSKNRRIPCGFSSAPRNCPTIGTHFMGSVPPPVVFSVNVSRAYLPPPGPHLKHRYSPHLLWEGPLATWLTSGHLGRY